MGCQRFCFNDLFLQKVQLHQEDICTIFTRISHLELISGMPWGFKRILAKNIFYGNTDCTQNKSFLFKCISIYIQTWEYAYKLTKIFSTGLYAYLRLHVIPGWTVSSLINTD